MGNQINANAVCGHPSATSLYDDYSLHNIAVSPLCKECLPNLYVFNFHRRNKLIVTYIFYIAVATRNFKLANLVLHDKYLDLNCPVILNTIIKYLTYYIDNRIIYFNGHCFYDLLQNFFFHIPIAKETVEIVKEIAKSKIIIKTFNCQKLRYNVKIHMDFVNTLFLNSETFDRVSEQVIQNQILKDRFPIIAIRNYYFVISSFPELENKENIRKAIKTIKYENHRSLAWVFNPSVCWNKFLDDLVYGEGLLMLLNEKSKKMRRLRKRLFGDYINCVIRHIDVCHDIVNCIIIPYILT